MSEIAVCAAPPRRLERGGDVWTETCTRYGRLWTVSKGTQSTEVLRCDEHAAELRRRGYEVKLKQEAPKSEKKKWDMTSTNSLEAGAKNLLKNAEALVVLVVRAGDAVLALADGLTEKDVPKFLDDGLPEAYARLEQKQEEQRKKKVLPQIRKGVNPEQSNVA